MLPRLRAAVFFSRLALIALAALWGLYGLFAGVILLLIYIVALKSYEVEYTISLNKITFQALKDSIYRVPWQYMKARPLFNKNIKRQGKK